MPGSSGFNMIFLSMVFPRVFLKKNMKNKYFKLKKMCWASTFHISWVRPCSLIQRMRSRMRCLVDMCQFYFIGMIWHCHQENMCMKCIPPRIPLLYNKTGVYRGISIFLIFGQKHRLWVLVRTTLARQF